MEYYFAPMEGITGAQFRQIHHSLFPGVDKYYIPFLSPTQDHVFTPRDLRAVLPEHNQGFHAVPQLLTRNPQDFLWAAGALADMGYEEVNLNLGCPSGTVTAKGKGAGLLGRREELERMLDGIFAAPPTAISLKTRLGMEDPEEFPALLELFSRYPVSLLIIHPRVRQDFYRRPVRMDSFRFALDHYRGPICFNGGLLTPEDCAAFAREFPQVDRVMLGQGLLADPAVIKAGVAIGDDMRELARLYPFKPAGMVDLGMVARAHQLTTQGLRTLAANLFGQRISKGPQCSNWSVMELSKRQVIYAATDAWIGRAIYLRMRELGMTGEAA